MNAKNLVNAAINRINRLMTRLHLAGQYRLGLLKEYQPNPFDIKKNFSTKGGRQCNDRFDAIVAVLPDLPLSFMDLGCNAGYFVFRFAARGGFGIGIDIGRNEIMACQTLTTLHHVRNVAFARLSLDPSNVTTLPKVDMIIFMSLFHHFVRHYGSGPAQKMLDVIGKKAERFLIFETGQPDEHSGWASMLTFMGNDPKQWAEKQLLKMGFDKIHYMGLFPTSVSDVDRHLFVGERTEIIAGDCLSD